MTDLQPGTSSKSWRPSAFQPWVLFSGALICWALIVILQLLLTKSHRDGGIIITADTQDLPFSQTFLYLYLPTILAIIFSILWNWIDLQVKRLEPYYQLSKSNGAPGKDSLLLHYPFDFVPFVPFTAIRNRHWAVFWASTAVVVVTWGLVPVQAGLFASETIMKTRNSTVLLSTAFIPADEQNSTISNRYSHSAHGIIWLNETLPPYMSRDYVLAPFQVKDVDQLQKNVTWSATTQLYSVDVDCEAPKIERESIWISSHGCRYVSAMSDFGNYTIGKNDLMGNISIYDNKEFSAAYIGYYGTDYASYYLEGSCPTSANHTFVALFSRNKKRAEDPPQNVTRLFCQSNYFVQEVDATIDARTRRPIQVKTRGPKRPLPNEVWNSKLFEYSMNDGAMNRQPRGDLPTPGYPNQQERLSTTQISLAPFGVQIQNMVGIAVGASNRPLEELLEPEGLRASYEAAYRVLFGRSMTEILDRNFSKTREIPGQTTFSTGAITLVPVFVYVVEGLLGFMSICAMALLFFASRRDWGLSSDPSTISSVMSLVADNPSLLHDLSRLDFSTMEKLESSWRQKIFKLRRSDQGIFIVAEEGLDSDKVVPHSPMPSEPSISSVPNPIRPREFRSMVAVSFISLQIALVITLGIVWVKAMPKGLARPSNNAIVRQIVENYIPTAVATLIEPVWILLNRLLCLLQPIQELRVGNAPAKRSIEADYSSLPPQMVIFKAIRSSHFKLAAVCLMALLANLLAVAFAGLFEERSTIIPRPTEFHPVFEEKFVFINGSISPRSIMPGAIDRFEPSGAYFGGLGTDQFLVAESNISANTPLPPWTDDQFFYVPFMDKSTTNESEGFQARTKAFGAGLDCQPVDQKNYTAEAYEDFIIGSNSRYTFEFTLPDLHGKTITCAVREPFQISSASPFNDGRGEECQTGAVAMELVLMLNATGTATAAEKEFCARRVVLGWVRDPGNICTRNTTTRFNNKSALFMNCGAKLIAGDADVITDGEGRVQHVSGLRVTSGPSPDFLRQHFTNGFENLLQQSHGYLFRDYGAVWHNDSYTSDFMNYFLAKRAGNLRLTDPSLPVPTLKEVTERLYPVYSKLFAIWLGVNMEKLLVPTSPGTTRTVDGLSNERHIRLYLSQPLFIISECILGTYVIVAIIVYVWRPDRFLPRMPTSIAAVIGLFAASTAVRDLQGTSQLTKNQRRQHLEELDKRYGYGTFLGADGSLHVGIEAEPLVRVAPLPGIIEKVQTGLSKVSTGLSEKFRT